MQTKVKVNSKRFFLAKGGQALHELHMDEHSITEILRLHLEASGGYRSDKSLLWNYQQKGGYRLSDDPGNFLETFKCVIILLKQCYIKVFNFAWTSPRFWRHYRLKQSSS